jgi:coenzyme A diphosphatase NUDT7
MTRRAGDMRTYAQDTALPGGKYEDGDIDAEGTAVCHSSSRSRR